MENVTLRVTRMRDVNGIVWHIRNGTIDTVGNESQGWARAVIDFPVPFAADLATIRDVLARTGEQMWNDPAWRSVMLEAPEVWGAQEITSDRSHHADRGEDGAAAPVGGRARDAGPGEARPQGGGASMPDAGRDADHGGYPDEG